MGMVLIDLPQAAELLGVTNRTLRFWEEKELLRGIQRAGKRGDRRYTTADIERCRAILRYQRMGFSLLEIYSILDAKPSMERMRDRLATAEHEEREARQRVAEIKRFMQE